VSQQLHPHRPVMLRCRMRCGPGPERAGRHAGVTTHLQALLAAAQAAGDDGPLRNAFLQLDGMLRLEAVQLGGGALTGF
jgi:hypothetical protein